MTTTPAEPVEDPEVVPSGDPSPIETPGPAGDTEAGTRTSPERKPVDRSTGPRLAWATCSATPPSPAPATRSPCSPPARGGAGDLPRAVRARGAPAPGGVRRRGRRVPHDAQSISPPAARAADVNAAFADPEITAILTSIGGDDQIKILKHLDADLIAANPKPFFGLSDNTNLHNYLWNLGIVSYYGGAVMTELGRPGSINPHSRRGVPRRASSATGGTTCGRRSRSPTSTATGPTRRTSSASPRCCPAPAGSGTADRGGRGPAVGRLPRDRRLQPARRALPRAGRRGVRRVRAVPRDLRGDADRPVRRRGADVHGRARPAPAVRGRC